MKQYITEKSEPVGLWTFKLIDPVTGKVKAERQYKNMIVTSGKAVYARLAAGDSTYTGEITRCAVGTGAASPTAGDVTLQTEIDRAAYQSRSRTGNVLTLEYYFGITDANGVLKEAGLFIDGTDTPDDGQLYNRVNIDLTKTPSDALIVAVQITF